MRKFYTRSEVIGMNISIPENAHGLLRNWLGKETGRLTVISYAGKIISDKHCWYAECSCGSGVFAITSTGLCSTQSCGCLGREATSVANKGNTSGTVNKRTAQTIEKLKEIKPEYQIRNQYDGKVMTKWDFKCVVCDEEFSARPDNILDRKTGGSQTPCGCRPKAGYDAFKDGTFYVLSIGDYCKFGISNDFDRRYKENCKAYGGKLEVEFTLTVNGGKLAREIELAIKSKFNYTVDVGKINGRSEYRRYEHYRDIIKEAMSVFNKHLKESK